MLDRKIISVIIVICVCFSFGHGLNCYQYVSTHLNTPFKKTKVECSSEASMCVDSTISIDFLGQTIKVDYMGCENFNNPLSCRQEGCKKIKEQWLGSFSGSTLKNCQVRTTQAGTSWSNVSTPFDNNVLAEISCCNTDFCNKDDQKGGTVIDITTVAPSGGATTFAPGKEFKCTREINTNVNIKIDKTVVTCPAGSNACVNSFITANYYGRLIKIYAMGCVTLTNGTHCEHEGCKELESQLAETVPGATVKRCSISCCSSNNCNRDGLPIAIPPSNTTGPGNGLPKKYSTTTGPGNGPAKKYGNVTGPGNGATFASSNVLLSMLAIFTATILSRLF